MAIDTRAPESIAIPEPELTAQEMIDRAIAMRPMLREEQQAAEERGYYSEGVHKAFTEAGFYRFLQPRMYGGYAFDMASYYKLLVEVARGGSGGVSWCLALGTHHSLIVAAFWPELVQREIFGLHDGHFVASARAGGGGTARKEGDKWIVNGRWRYSSGSPWSTHHLSSVLIEAPEGNFPKNGTLGWVIAPRDQYEIVHDWGGGNDLGLQASGSNTVTMKDAVVPEAFVVDGNWRSFDQTNGTFGTRLHNDPMYLGVNGSFFHGALVGPQVGTVRAALDEFEDILRSAKTRGGPPVLQMYDRGFQTAYGLALALCDAAEMILIRAGQQFDEYCDRWQRTGEPYSPEDDTRLHAALQQAGRLSWRAMEQIWTMAPVDGAKRHARLQRYYRDLSMYRLHGSSRPLVLAPRLAEIHFDITQETMPGGPG